MQCSKCGLNIKVNHTGEMSACRLLSIVISFLEHNHTEVFQNRPRDRTRNREETWLPVDTNSGSRKFPGEICQHEWSKVWSRMRESKRPFFFSFFCNGLCPVWSYAQWSEKSGCEPCNNKSTFPGEVTKTIALLGMLGMQGHPHNSNLPAEHKSWRKHLSGMKQLIQCPISFG